MQFLQIKSNGKKRRADGSTFRSPVIVRKTRKYGELISQDPISVKAPVLVTGAHAAGKTKFIRKLWTNEREIWGGRIKYAAVFLSSIAPISTWTDSKAIAAWWNSQLGLDGFEVEYKKLKPPEKQAALTQYIAKTSAVIFIDDAHKLTGRKLQLAQDCINASKIFVMSADSEQRLSPSLRLQVIKRNPQIHRLSTDVSYDATDALMWIIAIACLLAGFYEVGAVVGGLKLISNGKRSTKDT